jgi:hypothetical protein
MAVHGDRPKVRKPKDADSSSKTNIASASVSNVSTADSPAPVASSISADFLESASSLETSSLTLDDSSNTAAHVSIGTDTDIRSKIIFQSFCFIFLFYEVFKLFSATLHLCHPYPQVCRAFLQLQKEF